MGLSAGVLYMRAMRVYAGAKESMAGMVGRRQRKVWWANDGEGGVIYILIGGPRKHCPVI